MKDSTWAMFTTFKQRITLLGSPINPTHNTCRELGMYYTYESIQQKSNYCNAVIMVSAMVEGSKSVILLSALLESLLAAS